MSTIAQNLSNKFDALSDSVGGTRKLALVAAAGAGAVAAAYYVVPVAWQAIFRPEPDPYGQGEIIQPNVLSDLKDESLFLVIYLKCDADLKACAAAAARLQSHVVVINQAKPGAATLSRDYEVIAGVGFGQNMYSQVVGRTTRPFSYVPRTGGVRSGGGGCTALNATGGDIFIHAKSNSHSKLFELADRVIKAFPRGSIDFFEDLYGFIYKDGRDFTGCPYGRANPTTEADRFVASVNDYTQGTFCVSDKKLESKITRNIGPFLWVWHREQPRKPLLLCTGFRGRSQCHTPWPHPHVLSDKLFWLVFHVTPAQLTQKWIHDMSKVHSMSKRKLENIFGIYKDGTDMRFRCPSSHVARMRGAADQKNQSIMIYRQSMPFGSLSSREKGLFFVGFADDPERFEVLLDRMVGACPDGLCDEVFQVSRCITGQYWYFPSIAELRLIARKDCSILNCLSAFKGNKNANNNNPNVVIRGKNGDTMCYSMSTQAPSGSATTVVVASGDPATTDAGADGDSSKRSPSIMKRLTFGCGGGASRAASTNRTTTVTTTSRAGETQVIRAGGGKAVEVYNTADSVAASNNAACPRVVVRNNEAAGGAYGDAAGSASVNSNARLPVMDASGNVVSSSSGTTQVSYLPRQPEPYPSKLYFSNNGQISAAYRRNG